MVYLPRGLDVDFHKGDKIVRITKEDVPVRIDIPGATARQLTEFGDATGYGKMSGEYFSLSAGSDTTGLLQGLEGDLCQAPHWGYILERKLRVIIAWEADVQS